MASFVGLNCFLPISTFIYISRRKLLPVLDNNNNNNHASPSNQVLCNNDLLLHILSYNHHSLKDLLSCGRVCVRWRIATEEIPLREKNGNLNWFTLWHIQFRYACYLTGILYTHIHIFYCKSPNYLLHQYIVKQISQTLGSSN